MVGRRSFIKQTALTAMGVGMGMSAKSYNRIVGANERVATAIFGCFRRFGGLAGSVVKLPYADLIYVCDVDERRQSAAIKSVSDQGAPAPNGEADLNKILEDKDIDAVFVAIPDHWHAHATLLSLDAGKHVYVEKPCSHNPFESTLLIRAQEATGLKVQMGNQQRSAPSSREIISEIHNGAIGETYKAVAFYTNKRGRVPNRKQVAVPDYLNWDQFQGPAPRRPYFDILGDYNWHWDWHYGTAETGNNATHEIDVARWALNVKYPHNVSVDSGKYHFKDDGWPMYDTMEAKFSYGDGKTIKWDGKSRTGHDTYGSGRGTIIYGSEGSVYVDRGGYKMYDREGKVVKERKEDGSEGGVALGGGGDMTTLHVHNFFESIKGKARQHSPIQEGAISTNLCHFANISSRLGDKDVAIDSNSGDITDAKINSMYWKRSYERGWEPKEF